MAINKFEPEATEAIGTNGKGGNQPFTLREPLHAVGERQQIARAIRQPHQQACAQPEHHQAVGVGGKEKAEPQQNTGRHRDAPDAKAFLQFTGDGRG